MNYNEDIVSIEFGRAIVYCNRRISIKVGSCSIESQPGTLLEISHRSSQTILRVLSSPLQDAVIVRVKGMAQATLGVGQQLINGASDSLPCRKTSELASDNGKRLSLSEYSFVALAKSDDLLQCILSNADGLDKRFASRILKTAAAVAVITGSHGPFR